LNSSTFVTTPTKRAFRVLIVEDDARVARTLALMLGEDGYDVETAFDGAGAVGRLGREPALDAIIVDYRLPHLDGLAVASYARSRNPKVHVVVVTSYPEMVDKMSPPLDPPATLFTKPIVYRELTRELARALPATAEVAPR
jgi:two-component system response regulator MprA